MRRAVPLSIQLLLTFVGLLLGMAGVLTTAAYTSLVANLRTEASRRVSLATRTRAQALSQVFQLRQQRAWPAVTGVGQDQLARGQPQANIGHPMRQQPGLCPEWPDLQPPARAQLRQVQGTRQHPRASDGDGCA